MHDNHKHEPALCSLPLNKRKTLESKTMHKVHLAVCIVLVTACIHMLTAFSCHMQGMLTTSASGRVETFRAISQSGCIYCCTFAPIVSSRVRPNVF